MSGRTLHSFWPPLVNLCRAELIVWLPVFVSTGGAALSGFLQRVVVNRLVRHPSNVRRVARWRLPAAMGIRGMDARRLLPAGHGRRSIFLLGPRIGQRTRARVSTRDASRVGCPTRASSSVAIQQKGLGFRRALLDPAGSPAGEKRILPYAQICTRSRLSY